MAEYFPFKRDSPLEKRSLESSIVSSLTDDLNKAFFPEGVIKILLSIDEYPIPELTTSTLEIDPLLIVALSSAPDPEPLESSNVNSGVE